MKKLPMNAQAFFTPNKPESYLYHSPEQGLLTGRKVEIVDNLQGMENQPAHLTPPHLQPQITTYRPTVTVASPVRRTVARSNVQPIAPKRSPVVRSAAPLVQKPRCKHMTVVKKASCNCSSVACGNNECPLSMTMASGTKSQVNINTCSAQNCRWFEAIG